MTFDNNWENEIYSERRQINKFPFDWVVSTVNRFFVMHDTQAELNALELGCGTGNNLKFLMEFGFNNVHGIDGSESAILYAEKYLAGTGDKLKLVATDFKSMAAADEFYDLILDRGSITHNDFDSCQTILAEAFRVLKPGGFVISTMFSSSHTALHKAEPVSRSFFKAFHNEASAKDGLNTSFFSIHDIFELFSSMDIISCVHNVNEEMVGPPSRSTMWHIVAKKPAL